jgi:hypothetical protein
MKAIVLKNHLLEIADKITEKTTVEDVLEQFKMLLDIEEAEWQVENGVVFSHKYVKKEADKWLE